MFNLELCFLLKTDKKTVQQKTAHFNKNILIFYDKYLFKRV